MSTATQIALTQLASWLRRRAQTYETKYERIVEAADFGSDDIEARVDGPTREAIDLLARADEARTVVLELERKAAAQLHVVGAGERAAWLDEGDELDKPTDPERDALLLTVQLTIAKCVRGVLDSTMAMNPKSPGTAVERMMAFARDCEAGETSAAELVAGMFVAAVEQLQNGARP